MKADRVEVLRDDSGKGWLVRIQIGAEVIRRYAKESKDADESTLKQAAIKIAADEGYKVEASDIVMA